MKTSLKIICIILASILILTLGFYIYFLVVTKDVKLDESKLINMEKTISYYDANGNFLLKEGGKQQVTEIDKIPAHVQKAFIAVEDKRFYSHSGIDSKGLLRAIFANIKSFSFKEGGSTISQQLIKNTHLSNKKTVKRKLSEIKLAKLLEKRFTKDEILEKYLNTIYFGDNCYGITKASLHYFAKDVEKLTVNEGAMLAGIIKAPSSYSPYYDVDKCNKRKNIVLKKMFEEGYIDKQCYEENINKKIEPNKQEQKNYNYDFYYLAKKELNDVIKDYPFSAGNLKVYTTINNSNQTLIDNLLNQNQDSCDKTALLINKDGQITAYNSTCGDIPRQVGSTIKPLLVYAPAIENDVVYSSTPILDEKINFNGYNPSNFNDKYYGYVSVKDSLAKSLNSCAVKILNYTGVEKSKSYLKQMNFPFTDNDNSLCLALGATEKGEKLTNICSMYNVFLNNGFYVEPYSILKVESQNNGVIYNKDIKKKQIFSEETTHIINDMLESTVNEGTAKKLSFSGVPLCSKTGTVGSKKGNTDAYNISYNCEQILGVWFGNKDNTLMDNSIAGGTKPTILSSEIWKEFYKDKTPAQCYVKSNKVCERNIDKIELETRNNLLLASEYTPMRYAVKGLFKNGKYPKESKRFSAPKVDGLEISLVDKGVEIKFNIPEYFHAYIFRTTDNKKILIYDTSINNENYFLDNKIDKNTEYQYSIIPYFKNENKIIMGEEIFLQKIKTSPTNLDGWWADELN